MRVLAPRAFSCHVKVFSYNQYGQQSWIQNRNENVQSYNLKQSLKILKDAGYRGPLCIEKVVPMPRDLPLEAGVGETVEYLQDLMASIGRVYHW